MQLRATSGCSLDVPDQRWPPSKTTKPRNRETPVSLLARNLGYELDRIGIFHEEQWLPFDLDTECEYGLVCWFLGRCDRSSYGGFTITDLHNTPYRDFYPRWATCVVHMDVLYAGEIS